MKAKKEKKTEKPLPVFLRLDKDEKTGQELIAFVEVKTNRVVEKYPLSEEDKKLLENQEYEYLPAEILQAIKKWDSYNIDVNPVVRVTDETIEKSISAGDLDVRGLSEQAYRQLHFVSLEYIKVYTANISKQLQALNELALEYLKRDFSKSHPIIERYTKIVNTTKEVGKVEYDVKNADNDREALFVAESGLITQIGIINNKLDAFITMLHTFINK